MWKASLRSLNLSYRWQRALKVYDKGMTWWNRALATMVSLWYWGKITIRREQEQVTRRPVGRPPFEGTRARSRGGVCGSRKGRIWDNLKEHWKHELMKWRLEILWTEMGTLEREPLKRGPQQIYYKDWRSEVSIGKKQVLEILWESSNCGNRNHRIRRYREETKQWLVTTIYHVVDSAREEMIIV